MSLTNSRIRTFALAVAAAFSLQTAFAVDGVILIDQNKALLGNATPGDAPGFPVSITRGGSYRLSTNLTVPNSGTVGISIETGDPVTIDLNGFAILGPNTCSVTCSQPNNAGTGIATGLGNSNGVEIYGGTIHGMGGTAISLVGFGNTVRNMRVRHNGRGGIQASGIIMKNIVELNGVFGISTFQAVVQDNFVNDNDGVGIFAFRGTVSDNHSERNTSFGFQSLNFSSGVVQPIPNAGFKGNFFANNNNDGVQVSGGTQLGPNMCGIALCP